MPRLKLECICPATQEEWNKTYPEKWAEEIKEEVDLLKVLNIYPYDWGNKKGLRVQCTDTWYFVTGVEVLN